MAEFLNRAALAALLVLGGTVAAHAQTTVFDTQDAATDAVDDLQDDIREEFRGARDSRRFGRGSGRDGWYGSIAASGNLTTGNTETVDFGLGSRFGYVSGPNAHEFVFSYTYGEEDGIASANSARVGYDYNYSFNPDFYGFGKIRTSYDEFGSFERDSFVGAGVGYRIVNTDTTTWSLEAGPGYRLLRLSDGTEVDEVAGVVTSRFYQELSDAVFFTNDTEVLASEFDTFVTNDLGVNVSLNGPLSLRTSLLTEWNSDPLPGDDEFDNTLTVSLVYTLR